ncbi:phosphate:Na+ symporter [Labrenzia sp. EL_208]|uniref:Na/Pi cotransporter family protein n=1 Tax=Roseibium album TaxID=311410 RepID=UPI00131F01D4|nr:phosphate:Na+ symporter [Labrenzia sp. EL_195]MBG6173489.1 phosphate:Na+ symporter [Labrenzia sp. EL_132]MBG6227741.1 phosphate:Na+ symporter [Labrenzia sp. EL_208]
MFVLLSGIVGGLGLFFAGVWLLTENLKRFAGRRLRRAIVGWTRHPLIAFSWGALAGGIAQSMSVLVFVLVGMLTAGLLTIRSTLPIIAGANVGASVLVLLATLNMKLVMLFVIGATGFAIANERLSRWQPLIAALFGLGILFLGIATLQESAVPLVQQPWAAQVLERVKDSFLLVFVAAAGLTFLAQTSTAISILAIALAGAGVFSVEQTIMAIYGSNFGSSINTLALSWNLRGRPMQIAMFQVLFNIIPCLVLVPLFYIERSTDLFLVKGIMGLFPGGLEQQMAYVYLLFNLTGAVIVFALNSPLSRLGEWLFPATASEDNSRLHYIHDQALVDPETALDLVDLEQNRLVKFFTKYFEHLRNDDKNGGSELTALHNSFQALAKEIDGFLDEFGETDHDHELYDRLNAALNRQRLLLGVEDTLHQLAQAIRSGPGLGSMNRFNQNVIEALDTVVLTLEGAVVDGRPSDQKRLGKIAGDRGDSMQRIRSAYLTADDHLNAESKLNLLKVTNLCQRFFMLLSEFTQEDNKDREVG